MSAAVDTQDIRSAEREGAPSASAPTTSEAKHNGRNFCCNPTNTIRGLAITVIALAAIIGTVGLLVFLNQMNLGMSGLGSMSQANGFYSMLGGYGFAFIAVVLVTAYSCMNQARSNPSKVTQ